MLELPKLVPFSKISRTTDKYAFWFRKKLMKPGPAISVRAIKSVCGRFSEILFANSRGLHLFFLPITLRYWKQSHHELNRESNQFLYHLYQLRFPYLQI